MERCFVLLTVRLNNNIIVSGKNIAVSHLLLHVCPSCHSNLNCKLQTRPEDHLTFSYLKPVCSVPCMKNLMRKVFIEILNANFIQLVLKLLFKAYHISKISGFGNYTVHILEYYVSYCVKTRIHWGKRQSLG